MLTKVIKYVDYDNKPQERTFFFNMTTAELAEMSLVHNGSFQDYLKRIAADENGEELVRVFKELIRISHGVKTSDGYFIKDDLEFKKFHGSEAYSTLFMELIGDAGAAAAFVNGIVPVDIRDGDFAKPADGFRPGAETLPQSRRDQIAREKAESAAGLEATGNFGPVPTPPATNEYPPQYQAPIVPTQPPAEGWSQDR